MKFTIEQARILGGFTQVTMAAKLGMSEKTYIQYEKYRKIFRMDTAARFAELVGIKANITMNDIIFLIPNYRKSVARGGGVEMTIEELPEILTVKQVAEHIGWHTNTVYLRCASGELKSFKAGNSRRIRKQAYLDWIAKMEGAEQAQ